MIVRILLVLILFTNADSGESTGTWETSVSGSEVTIGAEHAGTQRPRPSSPGAGSGTGAGVQFPEPSEPQKTGILAELEGLTANQMCDQYFGEYSSSGAAYFEGAQFSGPLAEYCLNRTSEDPAAPPVVAPVMSVADLGIYIRDNAQMIIDSGVLTFEPVSGEVVINKDTYFASSATAYTAQVTVLNTPLELRFVPTAYAWDLGDGTRFTTATPGGPYPRGEVRGQYTSPGTYTPSVRISWDASIRIVGGGGWYNVPGDAYTVTVGQPLTSVEAEAVLTANR